MASRPRMTPRMTRSSLPWRAGPQRQAARQGGCGRAGQGRRLFGLHLDRAGLRTSTARAHELGPAAGARLRDRPRAPPKLRRRAGYHRRHRRGAGHRTRPHPLGPGARVPPRAPARSQSLLNAACCHRGVVELAFAIVRSKPGRDVQGIAFAQRNVERRGELIHHLAARLRSPQLQEAQVPLRDAGVQGQIQLRALAVGAPGFEHRRERRTLRAGSAERWGRHPRILSSRLSLDNYLQGTEVFGSGSRAESATSEVIDTPSRCCLNRIETDRPMSVQAGLDRRSESSKGNAPCTEEMFSNRSRSPRPASPRCQLSHKPKRLAIHSPIQPVPTGANK